MGVMVGTHLSPTSDQDQEVSHIEWYLEEMTPIKVKYLLSLLHNRYPISRGFSLLCF